MSALLGLLLCAFLIGIFEPVYGSLTDTCTNDSGCNATNNELCNTTDSVNVCVCNTSYTAGTDNATCFLDCPADPGFAHGFLEGDQHYEGSANISCDPGYTTGGGIITCKDNGTWDTSTALPCHAIDCDAPINITGYVVTNPASTVYLSNTTIECDTGYTGGGATITCEATGDWTTYTGCEQSGGVVDCGSTIDDTNGAHNGDTTFGGTASITCNTGYTGGGPITCEADGNWNETSATPCSPVDCRDPQPEDGYIPQTPGSTTYLSIVDVDCESGYEGTASQITCGATGKWSKYTGCSTGRRMSTESSLVTIVAAICFAVIAETY